jgi:hypothetical protein
MAKGKDLRVRIFLECTSCVQRSINKRSMGISRYIEHPSSTLVSIWQDNMNLQS